MSVFDRVVGMLSFGAPVAASWYELVGKVVVGCAACAVLLAAMAAAVLA